MTSTRPDQPARGLGRYPNANPTRSICARQLFITLSPAGLRFRSLSAHGPLLGPSHSHRRRRRRPSLLGRSAPQTREWGSHLPQPLPDLLPVPPPLSPPSHHKNPPKVRHHHHHRPSVLGRRPVLTTLLFVASAPSPPFRPRRHIQAGPPHSLILTLVSSRQSRPGRDSRRTRTLRLPPRRRLFLSQDRHRV